MLKNGIIKKRNRVAEIEQDISNSKMMFQSLTSAAANEYTEDDVYDINMIRTFNFGFSTSTKIYGTMQPQMLGVEAFRHTLTPSISYNYNPDFSDKKWGYYETYQQC